MFTPNIIKILKYLKDTGEKKTGEELAVIAKDTPEQVSKSLEKLISLGLITQMGGHYLYHATERNNQTLERLIKLHETVKEKPDKEILIRGVICSIPSQYLLHLKTLIEILEKEGIGQPESTRFLEQEVAHNYLKRITFVFLSNKTPFIPACMPPDYLDYLSRRGIIDQDRHKGSKERDSRCEYQEEDYLISQYPLQMVNPAKEYLEKENTELKNYLRRRGIAEWSQR